MFVFAYICVNFFITIWYSKYLFFSCYFRSIFYPVSTIDEEEINEEEIHKEKTHEEDHSMSSSNKEESKDESSEDESSEDDEF